MNRLKDLFGVRFQTMGRCVVVIFAERKDMESVTIQISPEMKQKMLVGGHSTMDDVFKIFDLVQEQIRAAEDDGFSAYEDNLHPLKDGYKDCTCHDCQDHS